MSKANEPAFPQIETEQEGVYMRDEQENPYWILKDVRTVGGLTKREYFAAIALQGVLAGDMNIPDRADTARIAREFADALLAELEKGS